MAEIFRHMVRPHTDGPVMDAATVVLLRQAGNGTRDHIETLMLRKNQGQAFGGLWVFPGGRLEEHDGTGLEGARQAAVREAAEETGLMLSADALVPLSHWTPPRQAPRRYLTWFFVAEAPANGEAVVVDGGEIGDHSWVTPSEALAANDRGEIKLIPPTWVTLHHLTTYDKVADVLHDTADTPVERFFTEMSKDAGGELVALWDSDRAYPTEDGEPVPLDAPGSRHRLTMRPGGWEYERTELGTE